ncbi:hypothetical protein QP500_11170, partial [Pauljensenia sp. UMB0018B]|nr:hypothetical protein [Pauljensenia sp. UMB0018B]
STDDGRIEGPSAPGSTAPEPQQDESDVPAQPAAPKVEEQQMRSPKQEDRIVGGIHYPQVYAVGDTVVAQGFDKKHEEEPP